VKAEIDFYSITPAELKEFAKHAKEVLVDGDRWAVIFIEPDEWLREEIEARGGSIYD
jgi:hypothetical protein